MNDSLDSLWTEKYRPTTLGDIVLSKEDREFFESLAQKLNKRNDLYKSKF